MKPRFLCIVILIFLIISFFSESFISASIIKKDKSFLDSVDIPTWYEGDEWTYTADPVYFSGETGSFSGVIQNFKNKVLGVIEILHDDKEYDVYEIEITGDISGEFSYEALSGDIVGEISGISYIRVSDLAEVKTEISSTGVATILFIDRDYQMGHSSYFFPPLEVYDFPLNVGEQWQISTLSESSGWFILEDLMDENYSESNLLYETVQCIGKETIIVPAGSFESYNINYVTNSLWYSPDVGNMVKSVIDETTENSTYSAVISLESFSRNNQPLNLTEVIDPQEAFIYSLVIISGQAIESETGSPINKGNIFIEIPAIDDGWNTITDELGNYMISIDVPLIFDDTPSINEFGSVGVIVKCNFGSLYGYIVKTLVIIADYPPETPVITGSMEGNIGTSYTYTFTSNDSDGGALSYIVDWGDDSPYELVGPAQAGEPATASHTWTEKGSYIISAKAEDSFGAESSFGNLKVTMPRNKVVNFCLQKFIHINHRLFQIIRNIFLEDLNQLFLVFCDSIFIKLPCFCPRY